MDVKKALFALLYTLCMFAVVVGIGAATFALIRTFGLFAGLALPVAVLLGCTAKEVYDSL